jgi:hypothetical protein
MPASQILPGQEVPHVPQLRGSSLSDVQPMAQAVKGGPQVDTMSVVQAPAAQYMPAGQALPQVPQLPPSLVRSVQNVPPVGVMQAFGEPGGHIVVPPPPQVPIWQATPAGQPWPQEPQLAGSIVRSAQ